MRVSVVMAGRNSDPDLLKEAINSIFNQTFQDFEFIFVDDGSDQPMEPIIHSISADERISVYRIEPSGLGAALNHGIRHSCGEYIARIDDDDISLPARLEKQVAYLDAHPKVSCLGTQLYYKYGSKFYPHPPFPLDHDGIVKELSNLHFVMGHTVLMFRRCCFDQIGGYRIMGGGQDLDLFLQLGLVGELHNLNEYLGFYTLSYTSLSVVNPKKKEAYVFALESALKYEDYKNIHKYLQVSIERLKDDNRMSICKMIKIIPSKRKVLIWITKYLGKNIETVLG